MNQSARDVANAIRARDSFILTSHARPDGDAVGSALALALALDALGKRTTVVLRDPVPQPYLTFPATERVVVTDRISEKVDAAILLECSERERPGIAGFDPLFLINIDHHLGNTMYGSVNWFDPTAAACGEQVADVIDGEKELSSYARINGRPAITLDVQKAQEANIVETGRNVRAAVDSLRA